MTEQASTQTEPTTCERCRGEHHTVVHDDRRTAVCSACGHVKGCDCTTKETACVLPDGTPR